LIFQDGGRRHVGFFQIWNFNGRTAQEGRTASPCQIWSKAVKPQPRYGDFSLFPRWRPSAILDLLCVFGPPTKGIWWSLSLCKIWLESISSFDNMHGFLFHEFGLKTPIHAPKIGVWGILSLNGEQYQRNPKRHILARVRVVWAIMRENLSTSLTCRWVPQKGINE